MSLVFMMLAGAVGAAATWPVQIDLGAGVLSIEEPEYHGESWSAAIGIPLTPWFVFAAEGAYLRRSAPRDFVYTDLPPVEQDGHATTIMAVSRLEFPGQLVTPFVAFGTGWGDMRWGDLEVYGEGPRPYTVSGNSRAGIASSFDIGLSARWSHPWPRVRVGFHAVRIYTGDSDALALQGARLVVGY